MPQVLPDLLHTLQDVYQAYLNNGVVGAMAAQQPNSLWKYDEIWGAQRMPRGYFFSLLNDMIVYKCIQPMSCLRFL